MQHNQDQNRATITVPEIASRLDICEECVYRLLHDKIIPNLRIGRRFIISRAAYLRWEQNLGEGPASSTAA